MKLRPTYCGRFVFALVSATTAFAQSPTPVDVPMVAYDTSAPLWQMAIENTGPVVSVAHPALPLPSRGTQAAPAPGFPELQTPEPLLVAVPGVNFLGNGKGFLGFSPCGYPPDNNGAIGKTQYLQWINCSYVVFDKTGAKLLGPLNGNIFWAGFADTDCATHNDGDPTVRYDNLADRWVVTQFALTPDTSGHFKQCVAVSTGSDATLTYNRYSFDFGTNAFPDYGKIGVWPDSANNAYLMGFNIFNGTGSAFLGPEMCAFDRAQMLAGAAVRNTFCFLTDPSDDFYLPGDLDGLVPPRAGTAAYFLAIDTTTLNQVKLRRMTADFAGGTSVLSDIVTIPVNPFALACGGGSCIPQAGSTLRLESLSDRLMYRFAYRNLGNSGAELVANHSVSGPFGTSAVRWYHFRTGNSSVPVLIDQGDIAPDANYRWMGSIAMDHFGNILVGYSESSSTTTPGIFVTGRLRTDAPGTMEGELLMQSGAADLSGANRWGDYTHMSVDPTDDCTFWYTNEYFPTAASSINFATRIGSFKFPACM